MARMESSKIGATRSKEEMPEARFLGARLRHTGYHDVRYEVSFGTAERTYELLLTAAETLQMIDNLFGLNRSKIQTMLDHAQPEKKA